MENTIIKLVDVNVDGLGTNIDTLIEVNGKLTDEIIKDIKNVIDKHKKEVEDWDTDSVIYEVIWFLIRKGYTHRTIFYDYTIEF